MKKFIALFGLLSLFLILTACGTDQKSSGNSGSEKRTIKIGYLPITHAVPLYIEKENELKDEFKNFELELVKFGSWPELMDALNTGRIDGASTHLTLAMKAKEQGIDLKAVALAQRNGNVLVTSNDVKSVEDLKGKNFAIPQKLSTQNILLDQMLKKAGLEYSDVKPIELPPAEMPAALAEGRIAGYAVAEPFGALSVEMGKGKVLYQSEEIWKDPLDCVLVLRNSLIQEDQKAAQEFVDGYIQAGKIAEQKDDFTREASSKYMKVDQKVMDLSLQWISYKDLRIKENAYNQLSQYLTDMSLLDNPPSYKEFVDNSLIDKAM